MNAIDVVKNLQFELIEKNTILDIVSNTLEISKEFIGVHIHNNLDIIIEYFSDVEEKTIITIERKTNIIHIKII